MQHGRSLIILFICFSFISIFTLTQAQPISLPGRAAVELLTNSGFETDANNDSIPDGWTGKNTDAASADKQKCNKPEKVFANTGDCAFMFKGNPDGQTARLQQQITNADAIIDGSTLTLSAFIDARSGIPDSKIATVKVKLSDDSKLKLELRLPANAASGYLQLTDTLEVSLPAGVSVTETVVDFRYGGASGKFFVDDASLSVVTEDVSTPTPTQTPSETPLPPAQLIASDGAEQDNFGSSVSLSADGNTALIGALYHDVEDNGYQGAAYVYVRTGETWAVQQQLLASDGAINDNFGNSVSLSADGNTAVVGAYHDDVGPNMDQGSAYIFVRTGETWTLQQQLFASDGFTDAVFGGSVSLSADGSTALIGAYVENIVALSPAGGSSRANAQGAAYVFVRSGSTWTQQIRLQASDGTLNDGFGRAVSLNADGSTALVGAHKMSGSMGTDQGAAYVFVRDTGTWTQQISLTETEGSGYGGFGGSVSLSADGNTALVGYYGDDNGQPYQGSAFVFVRSGSTWTPQMKLLASDAVAQDFFGYSVSLTADGNTALVGIPGRDTATVSRGAVYVYKRTSGTWILQPQLLASDGANQDFFGGSVSVNAEGNTALIGVPQDDISSTTDQGSAWVFPIP